MTEKNYHLLFSSDVKNGASSLSYFNCYNACDRASPHVDVDFLCHLGIWLLAFVFLPFLKRKSTRTLAGMRESHSPEACTSGSVRSFQLVTIQPWGSSPVLRRWQASITVEVKSVRTQLVITCYWVHHESNHGHWNVTACSWNSSALRSRGWFISGFSNLSPCIMTVELPPSSE